jgi:hypothetical protein
VQAIEDGPIDAGAATAALCMPQMRHTPSNAAKKLYRQPSLGCRMLYAVETTGPQEPSASSTDYLRSHDAKCAAFHSSYSPPPLIKSALLAATAAAAAAAISL